MPEIDWKAALHKKPGEQTLHRAIKSGDCPPDILHYFGLDCATRVILRERAHGREPDLRSLSAVQTKRRWLCAKSSSKELDEAWRSADLVVRELRNSEERFSEDTASWMIWQLKTISACSALRVAGREAPQYAARAAARQDALHADSVLRLSSNTSEITNAAHVERAWQCRRLAWWLSLSTLTERLWLANTDECPLPADPDTYLDFKIR